MPGFEPALDAAREAGALGAAMSGSGPTLIAFAREGEDGIAAAMLAALQAHGVEAVTMTLDLDDAGATAPGTVLTPPTVLSGQPPLTVGGKPEVLFVGAEYCPFCAAERWPLIVALARFGRFTALHDAVSSAQAVFPSTATFSFAEEMELRGDRSRQRGRQQKR